MVIEAAVAPVDAFDGCEAAAQLPYFFSTGSC
jgi:hypothetical protein